MAPTDSPAVDLAAGSIPTVHSIRERLRALPSLAQQPPVRFEIERAPQSPEPLFVDWLTEAITSGEPEPHAMTLSTCDAQGMPDARVLILKDLDEHGWWFATSASSTKGQQLADTPAAALTFHWRRLARQVRVRGSVITGSRAQAAADFRARGVGARAVSLACRQSEPLLERQERPAEMRRATQALLSDPDVVPESWMLYGVQPVVVEFWQADPDRLHTRLRYTRAESTWQRHLLWP
jgi:pyridoxamine 5'-phosphate oxidase